jgi:hypothetical protein
VFSRKTLSESEVPQLPQLRGRSLIALRRVPWLVPAEDAAEERGDRYGAEAAAVI